MKSFLITVSFSLFIAATLAQVGQNVIPDSAFDGVDGTNPNPRLSILSQMRGDPELEVMTRLLPEADVDTSLGSETGRGTVFAPVDSAFARFARDITFNQFEVRDDDANNIIDVLLTGLANIGRVDNGELPNTIQLIKYHILGDAFTLETLQAGTPKRGQSWPTLSGMNILVDKDAPLLIDMDNRENTSFIQKNIFCTNGWLNKVSGVLIPYNLTQVLQKLPTIESSSPSMTPTPSASVGFTFSPSPVANPEASASPVSVPVDTDGTDDSTDTDNTDNTENDTDDNTETDNGADTDSGTGSGDDEDDTESSGEQADSSVSPDDDGVCFPASAKVMTSSGSHIRMDQLQAGTQVRHSTSSELSSAIFLFTHRSPSKTRQQFVRLSTACGHAVTMTRSHYVRSASGNLVAAGAIRAGDQLQTVSGLCVVDDVKNVIEDGLYAPHSVHGDLVVDGIVVSGYSKAVHPRVAHALLAPVRWLVRNTGVVEPLGRIFDNGANMMLNFIPSGSERH